MLFSVRVLWRPSALLPVARLLSQGQSGPGPLPPSEESQGRGKTVKLPVSSLRVDTVAAAGLDISRQKIWMAALDKHLMLNGEIVTKKSASVSEGDVIEVDTVLRSAEESDSVEGEREPLVKRGRVEVLEIGERTRKGGYHLTLLRYKHYSLFHQTQPEEL